MAETGRKQGKFVKGQSGNPSGRPRKDAPIRAMIEQHRDKIINHLLQQCEEGQTAACVALLSRISPALRPTGEKIAIQLDSNQSLADQAKAIMSASASGEITVEAGNQMMAALAGVARIVETSELIQRVEQLENAQK
jgi:hypothetical protein